MPDDPMRLEVSVDPPSCEECLDDRSLLLRGISDAHNRFLTRSEPREIFDGLLEVLLTTTGSEYGFIGEAFLDDDGKRYLKTHAITNIAWSEETRRFFEEKAPEGLEFRNHDTLFGRVLVTGEPVIANEPGKDPRSGGLPKGHPALNHFLGLPFFSRGELVGMVGIANRVGGYDTDVIDFVAPLTATCANIVFALRGERKRAQHEAALEDANVELVEQIQNRERAESALARFFDLSLDLLCVTDLEGYFKHLNPAWAHVLGYSLEELRSRPFVEFIHPEDQASTAAEAARLLGERGKTVGFENRYVCRDGTLRWLRWSATATGDDLIYAAARDVTEQKQLDSASQQRLSELEARASQMALLSEMGELLQSCGCLSDVSKVVGAFLDQMFEGDRGAIYLMNPERTLSEALASWGSGMADVVAGDECWALRRGRSHRVAAEAPGVACDHVIDSPSGYICVPLMAQGEAKGFLHVAFGDGSSPALRGARDQLAVAAADQVGLAIANVSLRERLREQSIRDPLTGLFNRRYMEETLEREVRRAVRGGNPLAVAMIDLDHFKQFNDHYGHVAADELLRDFGGLLRDFFRREDVACRFGGEEFILLLPGATTELARSRVLELRKALSTIRDGRPSRSSVTFSAGVAAYPDHGSASETLVRAADAAMYRAKSEGRDRCVAAPSTDRPGASSQFPRAVSE